MKIDPSSSPIARLVTVLIEGLPTPDDTMAVEDNDLPRRMSIVTWRTDSNSHSVHLEACMHRIFMVACFDDGGPCPPQLEASYSYTRLNLFLDWMKNRGTVDQLYGLLRNGSFNQYYESDPPITKLFSNGRITEAIWHLLAKHEPQNYGKNR